MVLSESQRCENFNKKINNLKDNYTDSDIQYQKYFLDWLVSYIYEEKQNGKNFEEIENDIICFPRTFLLNALQPNISEFYLDKTQNLILKDKKILELHISSFLKEKRFVNSDPEANMFNYDENMDTNIQKLVRSTINWLFSEYSCKTVELRDLREQYLAGSIDANFSKKLTNVIFRFHNSIQHKYQAQFLKRVAANPSILSNALMKNIDSFFKFESKNVTVINDDKAIKMPTQNIVLNDTLPEIFYGEDDSKNARIFLQSEFFPSLPKDVITEFYRYIKNIDPRYKEVLSAMFIKVIKSEKESRPQLFTDFKGMLCERIKTLAEFLDKLNLLEHYNQTNNDRLDKLCVPELKFSYEELKNNLTDTVKLNSYSLEALLGLSSFYSNRSTKCIEEFCKAIFIFKKLNLFEKVYNDDKFSFKKIHLSDDELKEMCAQYDFITEIIQSNIMSNFSSIYSLAKAPEQTLLNKYEKLFNRYKNIYESRYPGSFENDYAHIISNSDSIVNLLYIMKNETIRSLIYSALKDNKKSIINWGYIDEHKLRSDKVLLGFDIQSLNMPIRLHFKKEELNDLLQALGNNSSIPCYVGNESMHTKIGQVSTQVLSVVSKDKKRDFLKNTKAKSMFCNHLKWIQRPMEKPEYYKDASDKFYDANNDKIIEK